MERIAQEAFITSPVLKSQQCFQTQKLRNLNLRQKTIVILKNFKDKQLVMQAVNNIGIPKNFIDVNYVESRPEDQLQKIYSTVYTLKKQVSKLNRHSQQMSSCNAFIAQSKKNIEQKKYSFESNNQKVKHFVYLKKQLPLERRIKQAISKELQYRQKIQKRQEKQIQKQKQRNDFIEKRKQIAKHFNKKANEIYLKQKEEQDQCFQKIQQTNNQLENQRQQNSHIKMIKTYTGTSNCTTRQRNRQFIKQKIETEKINFEEYFHEKEQQKKSKEKSYKLFKHKRMNSLNQRIVYRQMKSQQIRERKTNTSKQHQSQKIKKMIEKQLKIKNCRYINQYASNQNRASESIQATSANLMTTNNLFRNSGGTQSLDFKNKVNALEDQKENLILEKINQKNEKRQILLNSKVQQIKEKHFQQQVRRNEFKKSQFKLFTESQENDSFIHQKGYFSQMQSPIRDPQEQNIKKKHNNVLNSISCDQTIMRLRKLPRSILQKKLNELKSNELNTFLTKKLVNLFN